MHTAAAAVLAVSQLSVRLHASVEKQSTNVSQALLGCFGSFWTNLADCLGTLWYSENFFPGLYDAMQRNLRESAQ